MPRKQPNNAPVHPRLPKETAGDLHIAEHLVKLVGQVTDENRAETVKKVAGLLVDHRESVLATAMARVERIFYVQRRELP